MAGAVRIAFEAPVARAAWGRFCEANGFAHAFRMKGGGDVFRKGGVQVTAWGEEAPDGAPPAPADTLNAAVVQPFGTGDPAEAAAAAVAVLRAFPASLEANAEPRGPPAPEPRAAPPPAPARPRPLSRPRAPAAAFTAVPTTASEAAALLGQEERAALLWLPADGSARDRRGNGVLVSEPAGAAPGRWSGWTGRVLPAGPAGAALERLSDWTVGDPRRVVSARLSLCVREGGREAPPEPGEFWRLTPLGAAVRGALEAAAASAADAEAP